MKTYLVTCFSKTGNNRFLAGKMAEVLDADLKEIVPRVSAIGLVYLISLLRIPLKINLSEQDLRPYDEIIICGPVWGGLLLAPMRSLIKKGKRLSKTMHFATCCGSSDEEKDSRYGYAQVLEEAEKAGEGWVRTAEAFPVVLVLTPEEAKDDKLVLETRLSEQNFSDRIKTRMTAFIQKVLPGFMGFEG